MYEIILYQGYNSEQTKRILKEKTAHFHKQLLSYSE